MNKIDGISSAIISLFENEDDALSGSIIGQKLMANLTSIYHSENESDALHEFKADFGGIARFISLHCSSTVHEVATSGQDKIYSLQDSPPLSNHLPTRNVEDNRKNRITGTPIWKEFVNPNSNKKIIISTDWEEVRMVDKDGLDGISFDFYEVKIPSFDVHREMIREFMDNNVQNDDAVFNSKDFLLSENYWSEWRDRLTSDKKLALLWSKFRRIRLEKLFDAAFAAVSTPPETIDAVKKGLLLGGPSQPESEDESLRKAIVDLVSKMPLDDLLEIKIPLKYLF